MSPRASPPPTTLRGPWLPFARVAWVVVAITALARQTKWVVFGTALAVAGTFPFQLPVDLSLVDGDTPLRLLLLRTGFSLSFLLVPFSISVAVLRSHLFDIDILINRTLVYGSLTGMLIGLYFGGIVVLQRLFVLLTGEKSTLAVVASALAIAALFNPLRRRTQSFIVRCFYRKKYDARKTLDEFSATLRDGPRCLERRSGGSGEGDDAARTRLVVVTPSGRGYPRHERAGWMSFQGQAD